MQRTARRLSKSESRRERGKVARLLHLRDADEYLNSIRASQDGERQLTTSSGILIYPVIPLTYRFLNHPISKLRLIGRPRTTLSGIHIIFEIIYRLSPSSIMIPSSRPSALGPPLRLQSRTAKLLETPEGGSERLRANALALPSISTASRRVDRSIPVQFAF